ncbi:MAG: tail fiber protein [Bacteroidota bacterium]
MTVLFFRIPFFLIFLCWMTGEVHAQLGFGTTTPNSKSILELRATNKGLLLPRMTVAQRTTIAASLTKSERGMMVLDSVTGKRYYWDSIKWTNNTRGLKLPLKLLSDSIVFNPGTAIGDLISWDGVNWINKQPAPVKFSFNVSHMQPALAVNYCISLYGIFPAQNDQPFVGEIKIFGFNFSPLGWAYCDGQLLSIIDNDTLFNLIGTTYGGDGVSTFAMPDLRGRVPVQRGTGPGLSTRILSETGGTESQIISQ